MLHHDSISFLFLLTRHCHVHIWALSTGGTSWTDTFTDTWLTRMVDTLKNTFTIHVVQTRLPLIDDVSLLLAVYKSRSK